MHADPQISNPSATPSALHAAAGSASYASKDNPLDKLTNADNYRELRKMIGTQEESAAALGVTRKTIINRENKKERVTREAGLAIRELARIIGYELDDL